MDRANKTSTHLLGWLIPPNNSPSQPWSFSQRLKVGFVGTIAICLISFIVGTSLYKLADFVGLVDGRSIHEKALAVAISDPKVLSAVSKQAQSKSCVLQNAGVLFSYHQPLREIMLPRHNRCEAFYIPNISGGSSRVIIKEQQAKPSVIVAEKLSAFSVAQTLLYHQGQFEVHAIRGEVGEHNRELYILPLSLEKSLVIEYFMSDSYYSESVKDLIATIKRI